jgi:hypothetical protein
MAKRNDGREQRVDLAPPIEPRGGVNNETVGDEQGVRRIEPYGTESEDIRRR